MWFCSFNLVVHIFPLLLFHLSITSHWSVESFVIPQNSLHHAYYSHHHQEGSTIIRHLAADPNNNKTKANALREKAAQLRREVNEAESIKREKERSQQTARDEILEKKQDDRLRYSAVVPILKGDGSTEMERIDFRPRFLKMDDADDDNTSSPSSSFIMAVEAALPLGIILGEDETLPGAVRVDEVVEDGNGAVSGVKVGDLLRACTACRVTMEMPTWQIMAGGIGRPKTTRMMFSADGRPFEEVMEAVGSNRIDPLERPAWLVLERNEEGDAQ